MWKVEVDGAANPLMFDHDPTDDEIAAQLPKPVDIEPSSISTKRDIFAAYDVAAQRWAAMAALDATIQATGTAKQKTGSTAMLDKAYQKARRLAAAYADALTE